METEIIESEQTEIVKTRWKMPPPTVKKVLDIKPTCASCGLIAGIDCQRACEYAFGRTNISVPLPKEITFDENHQFHLSVPVAEDGRNFGNKKPKMFWFNSVRCAEIFLIEHGHAKGKSNPEPIGSGERLLEFLGGKAIVKSRKQKRQRASRRIKDLIWDGQTPQKHPPENPCFQ